ncbi:amino acid permease [Nonomuraea glycinis]|uniref:Amino acid transporter n=1 Tax=Nonomuraea glycinis TaxID=2047744 RepID=A0A918A2M5_9ACTN|nr:APC family permease [Nonomuraea glycinis]MCA2174864.1 amino acid permease [Nonomuraea glycinis]GGP01503.1 amino acid transporter [Nonomuraea glycinis]
MAEGLARRLGTADAVFVGLSAMIGAGIFAAFAPAAGAAGAWLPVSLALAAVVAYCNATSSARLAARYPESGGTYVYGRRRLGPFWGYLAGWGFTVGKTASCAAMALTFGAYVAPDLARPLAIAAVIALTALNLFGVQRSATAARVMVAFVLVILATVVGAAFLNQPPTGTGTSDQADRPLSSDPAGETLSSNARIIDKEQIIELSDLDDPSLGPIPDGMRELVEALTAGVADPGVWGVLQGAGLLFFAFAGYARIATMGEEVRDPGRTIPRAIQIALGITLLVYALVAAAALTQLGPWALAHSTAPLADVVDAAGAAWLRPVVGAGAAVAALGALLALLLGVSRTVLAMARERDLPPALAALSPIPPRTRNTSPSPDGPDDTSGDSPASGSPPVPGDSPAARRGGGAGVPRRAELVVGVAVVGLLVVADLRGAIGFSSFGVLVYYAIANAAALTLARDEGAPPKVVSGLGLVLCLGLAATLPAQSVIAGLAVFAVGAAVWAVRHRPWGGRADGLS